MIFYLSDQNVKLLKICKYLKREKKHFGNIQPCMYMYMGIYMYVLTVYVCAYVCVYKCLYSAHKINLFYMQPFA